MIACIGPQTLSIEKRSLSDLPQRMQKPNISLSEILNEYDNLDSGQRVVVLEYFLTQNNIEKHQISQAAYMLGRLKQLKLN